MSYAEACRPATRRLLDSNWKDERLLWAKSRRRQEEHSSFAKGTRKARITKDSSKEIEGLLLRRGKKRNREERRRCTYVAGPPGLSGGETFGDGEGDIIGANPAMGPMSTDDLHGASPAEDSLAEF